MSPKRRLEVFVFSSIVSIEPVGDLKHALWGYISFLISLLFPPPAND